MNLLIGTFTLGGILSLLALGVFITFRIFAFPDITADGSITLGASVAATLLVRGVSPPLASLAGFFAGMLAGACTGVLHTRFKINSLLSGILVMTALYSINLHIMGKSNVPLLSVTTLATQSERIGVKLMRGATSFSLAGWEVSVRDVSVLGAVALAVSLTG
ncbi:MAG: ABC transporter permease subunit, partial [Terriglobales bacterium]